MRSTWIGPVAMPCPLGRDHLSEPCGRALGFQRALKGYPVVVLHAFVKKTPKTPQRALEIARERAKEVA